MTIDLVNRRTVGAAFLDQATRHPDETALTIYRGSAETAHPSLTFGELARRAGLRAEALTARAAPGERVLICLPTGTQFVELYLACLLTGLVAVPVPPLGGSAVAAERVGGIAGDCRPALAFTTAADRNGVREKLRSHGLGDVPVEEPGEAGPGDARSSERNVSSATLAVLQYSSGSTGSPKGVMLDHGNILANLTAARAYADLGAADDDAFGSWLPLHHDFGLFLQLTIGLVHGRPVVLMPPRDFVRRPVEWFRLMDRFKTTVTAAPDFAFGLCLRLIQDEHLDGLDLSGIRSMINGSEPIHVPTLTAFTKRFARIGLRPEHLAAGYGLAESTVYVSLPEPGALPTALVVDPRGAESADDPRLVRTAGPGKEIVSVGRPRAYELRIVDPRSRRALSGPAIGEVWLRGDSVGRGYWNKPEISVDTFDAHLADDPGDAPGWLRTGDLGAVVDGELFITGRLKEMVIVRGRNLFPHDLEEQARSANPALAGFVGAAFGVEAPDERVVLVHEVDPRTSPEDLATIATDVLRRLTETFGVPVRNVLLVRRGAVSRTTSGKIQRRAMREQFLGGRVAALHSELDPDVRHLSAVDAR